jgi:hypothetical protein
MLSSGLSAGAVLLPLIDMRTHSCREANFLIPFPSCPNGGVNQSTPPERLCRWGHPERQRKTNVPNKYGGPAQASGLAAERPARGAD